MFLFKSRLITVFVLLVTLTTFTFVPAPVEAKKGSKVSSKSSRKASPRSRKKKRSYRKRSKHRRHHSRRHRKKRRKWHGKQLVGVYVQDLQGNVISDKMSDKTFNPASAIKLLTAYSALKKLGAEHQFKTDVLVDGDVDQANGVLNGNVYIKGNDPEFGKSDSFDVLKALSDQGIKEVSGKLIVSKDFSLYCSQNPVYSGRGLTKIFKYGLPDDSVKISGPVITGEPPEEARLVASHESEKLKSTLKWMLTRSHNGAAERIGDVIGGIPQLKRTAVDDLGIPKESIKITSASGLGQNRITPKHMMVVLKALGEELERNHLGYAQVMPVGGLEGTLKRRFTQDLVKGSVVAKTGTLSHTDGGVSALVGVVRTKKEDLYFVIFCMHGGVYNMRKKQEGIIRQLQNERGGPQPFDSYRS